MPERYCSNACQVLEQTGCPTGFACMGVEDGADDFTDCVVLGNKPDESLCSTFEECQPGSVCVTLPDGKECRSFCDVDAAQSSCAFGCLDFTDPLDVNGATLGCCGPL